MQARFEIGSELEELLENLNKELQNYLYDFTSQKQRKIYKTLQNLMRQATAPEEYSATTATILLNDDSYISIKKTLKKEQLWSATFEELEEKVRYCALPLKGS